MKRIHLFTAVLLALLLTLCLAACAFAADIRPMENEADEIDLKNGTFCLAIADADKIFNGGYFTASLYLEDHYDGKQIEAMAPGDTVLVNGKTWTVSEVVPHLADEPGLVDAYEIYTVEENDGYIVFAHASDGCYLCVIDDWTPISPVGDVRIMMPLPDRFRCIPLTDGEEEIELDMDAFVDYYLEYGMDFTPYNTTCTFEDGMLVRIIHASYPYGPAETAEEPVDKAEAEPAASAEEIPVWKFCHGVREGLETAVIKAYAISCEEGPREVEISAEEAEEMRRLAIDGVVTGKANGMGVTGGTWVYSFSSPEGEHLLSIELYQGWIVAADGMYNYR